MCSKTFKYGTDMTSLAKYFNLDAEANLKGINHKNNIIKRNIIAYMAINGESTLSETPGGRRPNVFGLANSAIYFAGINVARDHMAYVITDLQNNIILEHTDNSFELVDRPQCLERICQNIENFIATSGVDREKILGVGVSIVGRVNP